MIAFLSSAVAFVLIIILYRKNLFMAVLRVIALIVLFFLITGLAIPIVRHERHDQPIVLIDLSTSMTEHYPALLDSVDHIKFPHRTFFFHETLLVVHPEEVLPTGRYTDIVQAVRKARSYDPNAIVLVSDGNHNYGNPSTQSIQEISTPVYAFGVGTVDIQDVSIVDITYPSYVFIGDSFSIEITTQSQGYTDNTARLTVLSATTGDRWTSLVPLSDALAKNTSRMPLRLSRPGRHAFTVTLNPLETGVTSESNTHVLTIDVLEQKIRLLYYTEHPSFTSRFTLQGLRSDTPLDLDAVMKQKGGEFTDMFTYSHKPPPELTDYDVVILDNISLSTLPWHSPESFLQGGKGILLMGRIEGFSQVWNDILPIPTHGLAIQGTYKLTIVNSFSCLHMDEDYPPLSSINRASGTREGSVVIARADRTPVIAYRKHLNSLIFQVNTNDLGTWHFIQMGMKQHDVLSCLIGDIVRFLSRFNIHTRLVLHSLHHHYTQGETVDLTLQSYDRDFTPAPHGDFYVQIGERTIPFFEISPGNYKTSFTAAEPGQLHMQAKGSLDEEPMESNKLDLVVTPLNIERNQGLNKEFMQTLSLTTGGSYHSLDELTDFAIPVQADTPVTTYLSFDSPLSYFLIFALLAGDWLLRRRRGIV